MSHTAQHTPTPWREGTRGPNNMPVIGAKGLMIAHVTTGIDFQATADANAAFIVRAVNSHEQLVAALRDLERQADISLDYRPEFRRAIANAHAALAAAGAQP